MTDTGGPAVTAGTGGDPGPGPGPGLGTGEIAATVGTGGTPGEVTLEIGDLDLRAAADLADYTAVSCRSVKTSNYFPQISPPTSPKNSKLNNFDFFVLNLAVLSNRI